MRRNYESPLGDPSKVAQMFTLLSLKIWCCRYWCLFEWECNDAAFPYWRIYWNKNYGGIITHQGKRIQMQRENVYLIPPNTSFRSHIEGSKKKLKGMNVLGREVRKEDDENLLASNRILHLFIHFNLGIPFDHVDSNVFEIPLNGDQLVQLNTLSLILKNTYTSPKGKPIEFETSTVFLIQSTILGILSQLPENIWNTSVLDNRIAYIAHFIENNIDKNPSNTELAQMCHMTTNSLVRL